MKTRLAQPRVMPLPESEWTPEQRDMLQNGKNELGPLNFFRTIIRHADLYRRFMKLSHQLLYRSTLPARERELAILRVGWRCRSAYEFHQHVEIGKKAGLNGAEIERVKLGGTAPGWSAREAAVLCAVDELHDDSFVSDQTWDALRSHFVDQQLIELVFLIGQYSMIAMALNSLGIQIESDAAPFGSDSHTAV